MKMPFGLPSLLQGSAKYALAALAAVAITASNVSVTSAQTADAGGDARDLARVSAYLNGLRNAEGKFVQISPNGGTIDGNFMISRPGKIRFEYTPPSKTLVVADGTWVAVYDLERCIPQTVPLSRTPLDILLRDRVNLRDENAITGIDRIPGQLRVTAIDPDAPENGSITLIFSENPLELRQWVIRDAQDQVTTVALSDVIRNIDIPISKFLPARVESDDCINPPHIGGRNNR